MPQDSTYADLPLLAYASGDMSHIIDEANGHIDIRRGELIGSLGSSRNAPVIVSCGIGVNSVALLYGLYLASVRPDKIIFSELGDEKPSTYRFLVDQLNPWLESIGFPPVTIIQKVPKKFKWGIPYHTLLGNCLANRTLPSKAFGYGSCSGKWKLETLNKYVQMQYPDQPVYRLIGYDAGLRDSVRFSKTKSIKKSGARKNDAEVYPLRWFGWDRGHCNHICSALGFQVDHSSCFYCISIKPHELIKLTPPHYRRIVLVEAYAQPELKKIEGFWRKMRMTDFIRREKLLPEHEIDDIWNKWVTADRIAPAAGVTAERILDIECGVTSKPDGYRVDVFV